MIKEGFKSFTTDLFTKLDELKSSMPDPVPTPPVNPIAESLKQNTEALKALQAEVSTLIAYAATKDELRKSFQLLKARPLLSLR